MVKGEPPVESSCALDIADATMDEEGREGASHMVTVAHRCVGGRARGEGKGVCAGD